MRIHFLSEFSVCCHPEILLPWQRVVTTSPLYCAVVIRHRKSKVCTQKRRCWRNPLTICISKPNAKSKNEFRHWISVGFGFGVSSERGGGRSEHPHPTRPKQYCKTTSTWRQGSHVDGQEQKHLSPLGTELYFHVNSLRKNSMVLTPNIAALSSGCKPRILATII